MAGIVDDIAETCDNLGEVDLSGIKLEKPDPRLLDVTDLDLDKHVAMQAPGVAYYGALVREASRKLNAYKKQYDRWQKKKYAEARANLAEGTSQKITKDDIEARFVVDNESEIEEWEESLERLQKEYDTLSVWYDAWRQKPYSIRDEITITSDERKMNAGIKTGEESSESPEKRQSNSGDSRNVRDIIRNRKGQNSD